MVIFFISILIFFVASAIHSSKTKPLGITINFLLFSFLWSFNQESAIRRSSVLSNSPLPQLESFIYALFSSLGWVVVFYLGWYIAGKIIGKSAVFRDNLFFRIISISLFCGIILFIFEAMASTFIDWSYWTKYNMPPIFFLAGRPTYILNSGFYASLYFFLSFFLINCSKYKDRFWKVIFFAIPFLPDFVVQFFGTGQGRFIERLFILLFIIVFSIINPLRLICDGTDAERVHNGKIAN